MPGRSWASAASAAWTAAADACARRRARRLGRATRAPAKVSIAGSSVSEPNITSSTAIDAEIATP